MAQTTAIAVTEKDVGKYVGDVLPALIKSYAVRPYDGNAWMKTAALCIVESKELMACLSTEAGRISLRHALRRAATLGLSLNPQEGKAALVAPGDGQIHYWPMKNGLVDLLLETGLVATVRMNAIHKNDGWTLTETIDGDRYEWKIARRDRGEIEAVFCAIKLKSGMTAVEYMTVEEVKAHRDQYGKGLNNPKMGWNTSFEGMAIKTVVKRACNRLKIPASAAPALKAALAEGEAEPVTFEESPQKGASADDVARKLEASVTTTAPEQSATGVPGAVAPAGGDPALPASAQGSAPSTPAGDAQEKLDIF